MIAAYDDRPMRQTLPATPTDRSVPGDGIRLHARDWGDGSSGRPVVLFEDAMHDIPLQRPAELATTLASFATEAGGRG